MRRTTAWILAVVAATVIAMPSIVPALDGTASEIEIVDGAVGIVDPLAVGKGGTGVAGTGGDDKVLVGGGSAFAEKDLADCDANGAQFTYDTATNAFGCETLADADIPDTITIDHSSTGTLTLDADDPTTNAGRIAYDGTNGLIWVGAAGGSDTFAPVGSTTDTQYCVWDDTAKEIDCNDAGVSAVNGIDFFGTIGTLSAGSNTVYAIPGDVSATEDQVQTPVSGATITNLRCVSDVTPGGSGITITGRSGACGSLSPGSLTVTVTTADTAVADTSNSITPTAGQCISFSIVGTSTTSAAKVTCSVERSA